MCVAYSSLDPSILKLILFIGLLAELHIDVACEFHVVLKVLWEVRENLMDEEILLVDVLNEFQLVQAVFRDMDHFLVDVS
jgi:hypothetical protein